MKKEIRGRETFWAVRVLIAVLVFLLLADNCGAKVFYVAPDGDDQNPGTLAEPFASLPAAQEAVRAFLRQGPLRQNVEVVLRKGVYELATPFELTEADSGTRTCSIIYKAFPNETVRLVGGKRLPISAFEIVEDADTLARLAESARGKVLRISLADLGLTDYGRHTQYGHALPVTRAPLELFFNQQAMPLARYPNEGFVKIGKVVDPGSEPRHGDYSQRGAIFHYTDPQHEKWVGQDDIWFQGTFHNGYADDKIRVEWIDAGKGQVKLATPHMYSVASGRPYQHYVALNILSELDMPGEWYLDRESGDLYFWPPTDLCDAEVMVSVLEDPIVCLEGAHYVRLENLTVELGRGIGIYIERGGNNTIAGCTVRNVGTSGIFMGQGAKQTVPYITHDDYEGEPISRRVGNLQGHIYKYTTWDRQAGDGHQVISCDVYNTGAGGIYLSGGDKATLRPGGALALNCKVHNYNRRNKFLWSGINIDGCGNRIAHCEIYHSDFQAIYAHGNEHVFEYNHIHDIAQNSDDTSAWYLGRDPSDRGNIVRYNFFHKVGRPDRSVMGVYCDDGTTDVTVFGNVFHTVAQGRAAVFSNAGQDLLVQNNIFIDCGSAVEISSFWYTWGVKLRSEYHGPDGIYTRRLRKLIDIQAEPYKSQYPLLVDFLDPLPGGEADEYIGMRPRRNIMAKNVVYNCKEPLYLRGPHAAFEQLDNWVTDADPGFVAPEELNFKLRADAAVYREIPDFEDIPFEKIGLYADEFRTLK